MTDKDRMDRAKRIREMREGSREEDSEQSADGGEPDADEPADDTEDIEETADEDDEPEKQTMEELVESAAEEAGQEAEEPSDDSGPAESEADEDVDDDSEASSETDDAAEDETDEEAEVAELVSEAVSGESDQSKTESDAEDETDEEAEVAELVSEAVSGESDQSETESDAETTEDETEMTSEDHTNEEDAANETDDGGGVSAPLPDTETLEDALDGDNESADEAPETEEEVAAAPAAESEETETEEETRVLEFRLDDEHYCLDIQYIEEIVKEETITRVPNTPEFVQGVVDLRGQITTILNPKVTLGKENTEADQLIVVFDSEAFEDQGHIGWVVDDVRQVSPITESEVNDPPVEEEYINGVIDREEDDQFVIWTSPDLALEEAET